MGSTPTGFPCAGVSGACGPGVRAACPRVAPAQASTLYLCLYYIGSSVAGSAGGVVWADGGWAAVALFAITLLVIALAGVTMSR